MYKNIPAFDGVFRTVFFTRIIPEPISAIILTRNQDVVRHLEGIEQLFLPENDADVQLISPIQHLCEARCEFGAELSEHVEKMTIPGQSRCLIG